MRVSVVIPVLNEKTYLEKAVERAWDAGAAEVIVVDGGSDDGSKEIAQVANCVFVASPRGRAIQQNRGAAVAKGDILLFLHVDNWLAPNAIVQITEALATMPASVAVFRQFIEAEGVCYRLLERGNAARVRMLGVAYGDQGICVRRQLFEQIGGFPDVPLMEDLRFMRQARKRGRPVLLPGPLRVSARRWQRHGVVRQTLRNWLLLTLEKFGISPARLAKFYRPHGELGTPAQ